jgi:hypothetical protein
MKRSDTKGGAAPRVARSQKKRELQTLTVPTDVQFIEVVDNLGLADVPAAVLDFVIRDALADLRSYQSWHRRKTGHDQRIADPIEEIYKLLTKLVSFLEANPGVLKEILPAPAGEKLGELYSFTGIGKALDRDAFPDDGKLLRKHLRKSARQFDMASAEGYYARAREDCGLVDCDRLFLHALRVVLEPLEGWFAAKATNKGGRPANRERRYMIERLAKAASKILGSEPPISVTGKFVELCERVLPLCGFAEDGIDKAVVSVLSALKSKARPPAEPCGVTP